MMNGPEKDRIFTENTAIALLKAGLSVEESKLRHLSDEEIIPSFRYLMDKDKK